MPTVAERLRHVALKVVRAKCHIADLETELRAFLNGDPYPYGVGVKRDPESRRLIYYVASVRETPDKIALIAGDAIQNLMSALDHLAYQLVCSDTGDAPPNPNWIYFPIQDTAEKYEAKKRGKIEGAQQVTIDAIDLLKPYRGGNDLLWMLYRLNNIEKHRMLITVGSMYKSFDLGVLMSGLFAKNFTENPNSPFFGKKAPAVSLPINVADALFPLKVGDELLVDVVDAEPNYEMKFRFDVALYEPQIVKAQSILETLHQLTALVEDIVSVLTPLLKDNP